MAVLDLGQACHLIEIPARLRADQRSADTTGGTIVTLVVSEDIHDIQCRDCNSFSCSVSHSW